MSTSRTIIITSGKKYLDIDAYASMLAYRELLRTLFPHAEVYAVSSAKTNESVPKFLLDSRYKLDQVTLEGTEDFIIVDVSNPDFFDTIVNQERIIEIIDHHTGFAEDWQAKGGIKTQIELIGSVCTMIYEKYVETKRLDLLDAELCRLLAAGIIDNTLNLQASITSERDIKAYEILIKIGGLGADFAKQYLEACDETILANFGQTVVDALKIERVSSLLPEVFGQISLSSYQRVNEQELRKVLDDYDRWIVNIISLEDGKSYIYYSGDDVRDGLTAFLDIESEKDGLVVLKKFMLRKEIMKKARECGA